MIRELLFEVLLRTKTMRRYSDFPTAQAKIIFLPLASIPTANWLLLLKMSLRPAYHDLAVQTNRDTDVRTYLESKMVLPVLMPHRI